MLPNLSSLKLLNDELELAPIDLPARQQLPNNIMLKDVSQMGMPSDFDLKMAFALFKSGAVFISVDQVVRVDSSKDSLVSTAMQQFESMSETELDNASNSSGTYNRSEVVSLDSLGLMPNVSKYKLFSAAVESSRYSPNNAGMSIEKILIRSSKSGISGRTTKAALDARGGDVNSVLDELFQELYLTLYAASLGVGPLVYACKLVFVRDSRYLPFAVIPRIVYLMEAGDADLATVCENVNDRVHIMAPDAAENLDALLLKVSRFKFLMMDLKPGNMIAFLNGTKCTPSNERAYTNFKFIDFAVDFATLANTAEIGERQSFKLVNACKYVNSAMLALIVGTSYRDDTECMIPLMKKVYEFLKKHQVRMDDPRIPDDSKGRLALAIQNKMYDGVPNRFPITNTACPALAKTLLDDNDSIDRIVSVFLSQISHYILRDVDMTRSENANVPVLFRTTPYDASRPIIPQLVRNFLEYYQQFYDRLIDPVLNNVPLLPPPPLPPVVAQNPRRSRQQDAQDRSRSRQSSARSDDYFV